MPLRSDATFLGHALHPMIVPIPLGALPTALVFDILFVWTANIAWAWAALVATAVGVVGILAAAVPGIIDYRSVVPDEGQVRQTANRHLVLGLTIAVLYLVILGLRWLLLPTTRTEGWWLLGLNVVGVALLMVQGYLGGSLVENHHIGTEAEGAPPTRGERRVTGGGES